MCFPGIDLNSKVRISPESTHTPAPPSRSALPSTADTSFLAILGKIMWKRHQHVIRGEDTISILSTRPA